MTAINKRTGKSQVIYYVHNDNIGSVSVITDEKGEILSKYYYSAWGRRIRTIGKYDITDRGYTGHEHLTALSLINMNGRIYDPVLARFLSPDPYVQAPDFTQNYNRYSYCLNNPFKYTDPSGENPLIVAAIIGAVIGAYSGGVIANEGQYNPVKWDYNSGRTWGYMLGGAVVGGVSGYLGGAVAASGMPMANTFGLITSSFVNSVGTFIYTGGQTPVSINFGVASYDITNNEWGYLGKKGNKWYENLGYGLGAMANLGDLGKTGNLLLNTEKKDIINHSAILDENGNRIISQGPGKNWIEPKGTITII